MSETIQDGKFVELTYQVTDRQSGHVLTWVEFPLGYVHGHNEILAPSVHKELEGKSAGDVIEVPIDGNRIFGPRDESLVFADRTKLDRLNVIVHPRVAEAVLRQFAEWQSEGTRDAAFVEAALLIEAQQDELEPEDEATKAAIAEGLTQAKQGKFASDRRVKATWSHARCLRRAEIESSPHLSRFRPLALFVRLPSARVDRVVTQASENLVWGF